MARPSTNPGGPAGNRTRCAADVEKCRPSQCGSTRLIIAAPALLPLLWFEVLRNHSLVHVLFVYRSLAVSAGIVAVALLAAPFSLRGRESDTSELPDRDVASNTNESSAPSDVGWARSLNDAEAPEPQ